MEDSGARRLSQSLIWSGVVLGTLANIGGVLGIFGIAGSPSLGYIILVAGVLLTLGALAVRYVLSLRAQGQDLLRQLATARATGIGRLARLSSLMGDEATIHWIREHHNKEIYILGSGTETYYLIVSELLGEAILDDGVVL